MRKEFQVHLLNVGGVVKANKLAEVFGVALDKIEELAGTDGREIAIVRTKLEEANYFAKRAIAQRPENQGAPQNGVIENALDSMDQELTKVRNLLTAAGFSDHDEQRGIIPPSERLRALIESIKK